MTSPQFVHWAAEQLALTDEEVAQLKLTAVFDLFISRVEAARARGAAAPLLTVTAKRAGGNSRATTRRMLDQLRFQPHQRRAVHRLMAGSPSGWPGLLTLYALGRDLDQDQRRYARRQVGVAIRVEHVEVSHRSTPLRRTLARAGCVSSASAPYNAQTAATAITLSAGPRTVRGIPSA